MSQSLKKNAKIFYLLFAVFSGLFLILACAYITPYFDITVKFTDKFLNGDIPAVVTGNNYLDNFCKGTLDQFNEKYSMGFAKSSDYFNYLFNVMYDFDQQLQNVNNMILTLGCVSLVMVAIMFICSNHSRKKYYISNLISGVVCPAVIIGFAAFVLVLNVLCIVELNSNLELYNWCALANSQATYKEAQTWFINGDTSHFHISSLPLIIYSVIIVLFIVCAALLLVYNVLRYKDTQRELKLAEEVVE